MTTLEVAKNFIRKYGPSTRPTIAKYAPVRVNIRTLNKVMLEALDRGELRVVSGCVGKGSHANPARFALTSK